MRFGARFGARPRARVARVEQFGRERLFDAVRDFGQRQVGGQLDVGARARRLRAATAKEIAEAAEVAHEDVERVREIYMRPTARRAAQSSLTVSVEQCALVGVAQHVVRLGDRLELLFGVLRPVIAIGVVLHGKLSVRLLDVVVGSAARNT